MKKTLTIIAALALVLGMTQCKKAETPQATTDEGIFVTFTASYGGERTSFDPTGCSFTWTNGATEHIYVGCEGMSGCIGELSATGNGSSNLTFTGTLTQTPANGATLHFFYLGKDKDGSAVTSLDFSNQDGTLANLTNYHIAVGSQTYTTGMTNFSATLNPLVAFAYFDLSGFGTEAVSISGNGVYSTATIDYRNGKITIADSDKGSVNVGTPLSGGNYVALIPSTSVSSTDYATTVEFGNTGYSGSLEFKRGIFAGRYYTTANGDALEVAATSAAPDYVFTVDGEGTTVQFSPGNLQYTMSTSTWSFMENQYDIVETNDQNVGENYGNQNIVSLFAWGANGLSGVDPYDTYYYWQYTSNLTLTGDYPSDWGAAANAANLGGHNDWRTLTKDEWEWLLGPSGSSNSGTNCRDNATRLRGWKTVNEVNGLVILPDGCTHSISEDWSVLESHGAVFLPAAGYRSGTDVTGVGDYGSYWSASPDEELDALSLDFDENGVDPGYPCYRGDGLNVRLVR